MDKKVMIILAVVVILIFAFMAFMMVTLMGINKEIASVKSGDASISSEVQDDNNKENEDSAKKEVKPKEKEKKVSINDIETYSFGDPITTVLIQDPLDTNSHIAKIGFAVGMDKNNKETKKIIETFTAKDLLFRDMIITIVSSKNLDFYNGANAKEQLKKEIKEKFSKELNTTAIVEIYMPEYYVQ